MAVQHTIAIRVDVKNGDFVAHDGISEFQTVVWGHLDLPLLTGLGGSGLNGDFAVMSRVVRSVNVPVKGGLGGFGVAVVVRIVVGEGQRFIGVSIGCGGDGHVGNHWGVVGWQTLRDGELEVVPSVTAVGAVAVGFHHGDVNRGRSCAPKGRHPVKGPGDLRRSRVGSAVLLCVDVDTRSRTHQLTFVNHDVEATSGWIAAARDADGHRIHGTSDVGAWEVV